VGFLWILLIDEQGYAWVWRNTLGSVFPKLFHYEVGGEF
jgi:hypothetical protein